MIFDVMLYFDFCGLSKKNIFVIQLFIILGKYHIHKCKWSNSQPCFKAFHFYFKLYYKTIENMKAIRTFHLLKEVHIFYFIFSPSIIILIELLFSSGLYTVDLILLNRLQYL